MSGRTPAFSYAASLGWPVWLFLFFTGYYAFRYAGILYYHTFPELFASWRQGDEAAVQVVALNVSFALIAIALYLVSAAALLRRKAKGFRLARGACLAFALLMPAVALSSYLLLDYEEAWTCILHTWALAQTLGNAVLFLLFCRIRPGGRFS